MTLLAPAALAFAALSVPVVLMYVLKLRRKQHVVSSTLLWRRALDDVQANAPWQRLRPSLLLVLQLLALLALVLALARPAYTSARHVAGDLILIVDESYGMQAHDVAPTRFAVALAQARALAGDLPDGSVASVIGMGAQPRLAIAESSDGGAIGRAIDGLQPGASAPNFLGALSLAASLARTGETTRAVVLTSRESSISTLPLRVPIPVEIVRIGTKTLHDLGITAFNAVRAGRSTRALARVGNFGGAPERSDLDLYVDGQLADVRPLQIAPGREETLFWTDLPGGTQTLEVRLAHADDVDADKAAYAVIETAAQRRVLLVSGGDYFVKTALSLDPAVRLNVVAREHYHQSLARGYDLVVFDGVLPHVLPGTAVLLLSPPAGQARLPGGDAITLGGFQAAGPLAASGGAVARADLSPILRFVDLSDVHVARARKSSLPEWVLPIITSTTGRTLLAAGETSGSIQAASWRMAVMPFNLQESDWPLRISFPILVQNLLRYLAPVFGPGASSISAGQTVRLAPPPGTTAIRIVRPDGSVASLQARAAAGGVESVSFADTAQAGVYSAAATGNAGQRTVRFAVNFFPARPAPAAGPQVVTLGAARPERGRGSSGWVSMPTDIGWALALVVLAVLSVEWWLAFRR